MGSKARGKQSNGWAKAARKVRKTPRPAMTDAEIRALPKPRSSYEELVDKAVASLEEQLKKSASWRSDKRFTDSISAVKAMMEKSVRALENEATREEEVCRIVGSDLIGSVRQVE